MTHFEKEKPIEEQQGTILPMEKNLVPGSPILMKVKEEKESNCENKKWNSFQKVLAIVVILQILFSIYLAIQISELRGTPEVALINNEGAKLPDKENPDSQGIDLQALTDDDAVKGNPKAPVTIVEFSDYECPFCVRFYEQTLKSIEDKYIKTGKVKLIYRDFPLNFHPKAQKAAEAAECAGEQGKYYEMHNKLFEEGVQGGVTAFKKYAQDLNLDTTKFNACLDQGKMAAEVRKDAADGQKLGVSGTPAFFINGKEIVGAQPFAVFEQAIEEQLKNN